MFFLLETQKQKKSEKILPLHIRNPHPQPLEIHNDILIHRKRLAQITKHEIPIPQYPNIQHTSPISKVRYVMLRADLPCFAAAGKLVPDRHQIRHFGAVKGVKGLCAVVGRGGKGDGLGEDETDEVLIGVGGERGAAAETGVVEDDGGADGAVECLGLVPEAETREADSPIVVKGRLVDEVDGVNLGEGDHVVPFYGALDAVAIVAAESLDGVVALAGCFRPVRRTGIAIIEGDIWGRELPGFPGLPEC